ncbi:MAG TPA: Ig-like domain-containing protein, partial [Bdellovibrionales bacterium]|nr:Ig-like domain-containing protein [Bdellovibrionales bacterium]
GTSAPSCLEGGTLEVGGNLELVDCLAGGTTAITLNGTGNQTITHSGGIAPGGTFTVNKPSGTTTLATNLVLNTAGQDLVIAGSGNFDMYGRTLTVNDNITQNGPRIRLNGDETVNRASFTPTSGVVQYVGAGTYTGFPFGNTYADFEINFTGTFTMTGPLSAKRLAMGHAGGVLNAAGHSITVTDSFILAAASNFNHGNNTVYLRPTAGTNMWFAGPANFYNLDIGTTSAAGIYFSNNVNITVANNLVMTGAAGQLLTLHGYYAPTRWSINPQGTRTIGYLAVRDSNNTNTTYINAYNTNSTDLGNNVGWNFAANSAPVAVADTYSVDEGASATTLDVKANDTDSNGDALTITAASDPAGGTTSVVAGVLSYTPDAGFNGVDTFTYTLSDGTTTATGNVTVKVMNPFTWDGGGGDANWTTGANWHGNAAPNNTQTAIFDGTCSANCNPTIDASITVAGVKIASTYSGTIAQGAGNTITVTGEWNQAGGAFDGNNADITLTDWVMSGGSFEATTGTMTVIDDITVYGNPTFAHNNGSFVIGNNDAVSSSVDTERDDAANFEFYNLRLYKSTGAIVFAVNGNLIVARNEFVCDAGGAAEGYPGIFAYGNVTVNQYCDRLNVRFTGTGNQTFTGSASSSLMGIQNYKSGGVLSLAGTIRLNGDWNSNVSGGATMNAGTSTVRFGHYTWGGPGLSTVRTQGEAFNNVVFEKTATNHVSVDGDTPVNGSLTINQCAGCQVDGSTLRVRGAFTHTAGGGGTAAITLDGTGAQTITHTAGTMPSGTFTINKTSGTATLATNLTLSAAGQDLVVQA